jgi:nitroimidazol reductase NimA-like FMN-containing flavoprotein (pyridoxamine 5'-phosphate oxidase superfamily)
VASTPGIRTLSTEECSGLLSGQHVGRIALNGPDGPAIFPVNYIWEGGHVVIRTDPGTKLAAAAQNVVAFEIDGIDEAARSGWSVLVVGTAYEVTDSVDFVSQEARRLPVDPWAPGDKASVLRIEPRSVTGRAVGPGEG